MLQKIVSKKVELPPIWLVENEEDYKALPKGIPFIVGTQAELKFITIYLEFQTLYRSCVRTGLPIKWLDALKRIGYGNDIKTYQLSSGGEYEFGECAKSVLEVENFVEDQYIVDFDALSALKILPTWLDDIRTAIEANIIDEVIFDPTAFNKSLGMNIGAGIVKHNKRNLLILDVSGSIPTGVVLTITSLAKLMSKRFHADIMVTGGQTFFIDYEDVQTSDIVEIARTAGRNNEGVMYKKIVEQVKQYGTAISFGDNDSPINYSEVNGDLKPKFEIDNLYSLHTDKDSNEVTGYAKYLKYNNVTKIKDWVSTIQK